MTRTESIKSVAVVGSGGVLGAEFKELAEWGGFSGSCFDRKDLDLTSDASKIKAFLKGFDVVINTSGYTNVDMAPHEKSQAQELNVEVPRKLAEITHTLGSKLVHFSSDYVFHRNSAKPIGENEPVNPVNYYGVTKALGEHAVIAKSTNSLVIRTAWLYGRHGTGFPKRIFNKLLTTGIAEVTNREHGTPTSAELVAQKTLDLVARGTSGIRHVVPQGYTSRYEFAKVIERDVPGSNVVALDSEPAGQIEKRPMFSVLANSIEDRATWEEVWKSSKLRNLLINGQSE